MYFPYLRGRQFELIALRELLEKSKLCRSIVPVVEPVNLSSTLLSTLETFIEQDRNVIVIQNPQVGRLSADLSREDKKHLHERYLELQQDESVFVGYIMTSSENQTEPLPFDRCLAVIMNNVDHLRHYNALFSKKKPQFTFVPYEPAFRRGIKGKDPLVLLEDRFPKMDRNKDYATSVDNSFTSDHLYFEAEGYTGFSDYSIVGDGYSESGFLPHAVAIHMVYFGDQEELRIHHYVSDSNDDHKDPAGKFSEALQKLIECPNLKDYDTVAMQQFTEYYTHGTYPGLGVVKKLSIMHHLELMGKYLDEAECP